MARKPQDPGVLNHKVPHNRRSLVGPTMRQIRMRRWRRLVRQGLRMAVL